MIPGQLIRMLLILLHFIMKQGNVVLIWREKLIEYELDAVVVSARDFSFSGKCRSPTLLPNSNSDFINNAGRFVFVYPERSSSTVGVRREKNRSPSFSDHILHSRLFRAHDHFQTY